MGDEEINGVTRILFSSATVLDLLEDRKFQSFKVSPSIRSKIQKYYAYSCVLSVMPRDSPTFSRISFLD